MASASERELGCGARIFHAGDWRGARWPSSLLLGPSPTLPGVPAGLDSSCVTRRGRPDGEGTSGHRRHGVVTFFTCLLRTRVSAPCRAGGGAHSRGWNGDR